MRVHQNSTCSWTKGRCCSLVSVFVSMGTLLRGCFPSPVLPLFPLFYQCGGSRLGYQDLPAMGAVSIWELTVNSGSSWMSQALNLHLAMQLLTRKKFQKHREIRYLKLPFPTKTYTSHPQKQAMLCNGTCCFQYPSRMYFVKCLDLRQLYK